MHRMRTLAALVFFGLVAGCSGLTVESEPEGYSGPARADSSPQKAIAIDDITVNINGTRNNTNPGFVQRFSGALRTAKIFSAVYEPSDVHEAPQNSAHLRLTVDETIDPHMGAAVVKGIFIGLTLFLLTPALPLRIDKDSAMTCEVELPGGNTRRYEAVTQAHYYFTIFANAALVGNELDNTTISKSIDGLIARMREDQKLLEWVSN